MYCVYLQYILKTLVCRKCSCFRVCTQIITILDLTHFLKDSLSFLNDKYSVRLLPIFFRLQQSYAESNLRRKWRVQYFIFCSLTIEEGCKPSAINTVLFKHLKMIRTSRF